MLEFIENHTNLIRQVNFDSPHFHGINPYTLGFNIFSDIKRMCENPTEEDKKWFPDLAGQDWLQSLNFAMQNFKDDSFIAQYLSPKVIRDMKLFTLLDDPNNTDLIVSAIHDENGYRTIREALSNQYNLSLIEPNIQVYNVDLRGNRALTLRHIEQDGKPLSDTTEEVLQYLHTLWGFDIKLESVTPNDDIIKTFHCPAK